MESLFTKAPKFVENFKISRHIQNYCVSRISLFFRNVLHTQTIPEKVLDLVSISIFQQCRQYSMIPIVYISGQNTFLISANHSVAGQNIQTQNTQTQAQNTHDPNEQKIDRKAILI